MSVIMKINKQAIHCHIFEWGWETLIDQTLFEKEIHKNEIYLVIQDNHFNPNSSWHNHQIIGNEQVGQSKVFIQVNRNAEINGEEFNQEEIEFAKIIIGKLLKISQLSDNPEITKTFFDYHQKTPIYHIQVTDIFSFKEYLKNPKLKELSNFTTIDETDFGFFELKNNSYHIDYANLLADDLIIFRVYFSEYHQQFYLISKESHNGETLFFIRFFYEYYVDKDSYYLADYLLNQDEIGLFKSFNQICKNFFIR